VLDGRSCLAFEWLLFGPEGALIAAAYVSFSKDLVSGRLLGAMRGSPTLCQRQARRFSASVTLAHAYGPEALAHSDLPITDADLPEEDVSAGV